MIAKIDPNLAVAEEVEDFGERVDQLERAVLLLVAKQRALTVRAERACSDDDFDD
jgi:hypothetical protein